MPKETIVVKIGTSSLTRPNSGELALSTIASLVESLTQLRSLGYQVVLVSSGAVGVGCMRLELKERPKKVSLKQAVAAVGQGRLIRIYDDIFDILGQPIAQVLVTRRDLMDRNSYINIYNTFSSLLELGVIPIVNENDTVAVEELRFGDNDTLSALVASVIEADWLFILTDIDKLYSADPRIFPDAQPISFVSAEELAKLKIEAQTTGSQWGTGGMSTKIAAARIATGAGIKTVIMHGQYPRNILSILLGETIGTQFEPQKRTGNARKRWIAYGLVPLGKLYLDQGAVNAITKAGKSLLPAGVVRVEGEFTASDAVSLCNIEGLEVARGLANYSQIEIEQIKGRHSEQIENILGYLGDENIVHRDNLVVIA